jgi:hypothetical protein
VKLADVKPGSLFNVTERFHPGHGGEVDIIIGHDDTITALLTQIFGRWELNAEVTMRMNEGGIYEIDRARDNG